MNHFMLSLTDAFAHRLMASLVLSAVILFGAMPAQGESREENTERRLQALEAVKFSGSFRMNFGFRDDDEGAKDRAGDTQFNLFNLGVDTEADGIRFSGQYRWYNFTDTVHHLYFAVKETPHSEFQLGLMQVPFGILPYEANSWWFGIPYYLGLNDDYDSGFKYLYQSGRWDIQAAFYLGTEFSADNNRRYSVDVLHSADNSAKNEEDNTVNLRLAYDLAPGEVGVSLQAGQLYNSSEEKHGNQWAAAVHHVGFFGALSTQLELIQYQFNGKNPPGSNDDVIWVGALQDTYQIAAKGMLAVFNVAYDVGVNGSRITNLRFYNDYSVLNKDARAMKDSQLNVTGVGISAGRVYSNIDVIMGRNVLYVSGVRDAYAAGSKDDWGTRFNINIGYYF